VTDHAVTVEASHGIFEEDECSKKRSISLAFDVHMPVNCARRFENTMDGGAHPSENILEGGFCATKVA
jgi:hypothetical protein